VAVFRAEAHITLKHGVLDPQGKAVHGALEALGYSGVEQVRLGKLVEIEVQAKDSAEARSRVEEMCRKLLANPVLEEYRVAAVELLPNGGAAGAGGGGR
jgi:phosphoribosylformylglycinamidine synthase